MEGFPAAIIMARQEEVMANPNVLFRLVKPNADRDGMESSSGLVNVVPQRRAYRMEKLSELEAFERELLRRPLVLQPNALSGVGIMSCALWTTSENWILLINQTHPKILGRLQIGADAAKAAMTRGDPFQLRYQFGKVLRRLHHQVVERLDADVLESPVKPFLFASWDYAELIVRFPGSHLRRRVGYKPVYLDFDFSDLEASEILLRSASSVLTRDSGPVTPEDISHVLPDWTINHVSPLTAEGEIIPDSSYSYAQAGRLYQSFRKKKRQRPTASDSSQEPSSPHDLPSASGYAQAASAYPQASVPYPQAPAPYPQASPSYAPYPQGADPYPRGAAPYNPNSPPHSPDFEDVALDDVHLATGPYPSRSPYPPRSPYTPRSPHPDAEDAEVEMYDRQARSRERDREHERQDRREGDRGYPPHHEQGRYPQQQQLTPRGPPPQQQLTPRGPPPQQQLTPRGPPPQQHHTPRGAPPPPGHPVPQPRRSRGSDSHEKRDPNPSTYTNLYPEVRVMGEGQREEVGGGGRRDWSYGDGGERLRDSDRSSHSTASGHADSGYADSDLEFRHPGAGVKGRGQGRLNPAFHHEEQEVDDVMRRHEEMVKRALEGAPHDDKLYPSVPTHSPSDYRGARPKTAQVPLRQPEEGMAESYI